MNESTVNVTKLCMCFCWGGAGGGGAYCASTQHMRSYSTVQDTFDSIEDSSRMKLVLVLMRTVDVFI